LLPGRAGAKTDAYVFDAQNNFRVPSTCSPAAGFRSSCSGTLNEVSGFADYHIF